MYKGIVHFFHPVKKFGFINCPELDLKDIFFHLSKCEKSYQNPIKGDEVDFELKKSIEFDYEWDAHHVKLETNLEMDLLYDDFEKHRLRSGFLLFRKGKFLVKDRKNGFLIPVQFSFYDYSPPSLYHDLVDKKIQYHLVSFEGRRRPVAVVMQRQILPEYLKAITGKTVLATVIEVKKEGYVIRVLGLVVGWLPKKEWFKGSLHLGQKIEVQCQRPYFETDIPEFTQAEKLVKVKPIKQEQFTDYLIFAIKEKWLSTIRNMRAAMW